MRPQVILFSTSEAIWGGSQIFNERLCDFLVSEGYDATLATPTPELYNCQTLSTESIRNPTARLKAAVRIAKRMRSSAIPCVILDDLSGLWLAPIFRLFRLKVFVILHLQLQRRNKNGFGHSWWTFQILRFSSLFAHKIFSIGRANVDVFPSPVEFIGNAVPDFFFAPANKTSRVFDLGTISRLASEKNLGLLIHLVDNLNRIANRRVTCVIVGGGPEREALIKMTESLGLGDVVTFMPWARRDELPAILDQIRCFAITSHHEGFPTSLLESHARGLPALVTNTSGYSPEFIGGGHKPTGIAFERGDIQDPSFVLAALKLIETHADFIGDCVSKAALFKEEIVFGKIRDRLRQESNHCSIRTMLS